MSTFVFNSDEKTTLRRSKRISLGTSAVSAFKLEDGDKGRRNALVDIGNAPKGRDSLGKFPKKQETLGSGGGRGSRRASRGRGRSSFPSHAEATFRTSRMSLGGHAGELDEAEDDYSETTDVSEPSFAMDDESDGEEVDREPAVPDQKAHLLSNHHQPSHGQQAQRQPPSNGQGTGSGSSAMQITQPQQQQQPSAAPRQQPQPQPQQHHQHQAMEHGFNFAPAESKELPVTMQPQHQMQQQLKDNKMQGESSAGMMMVSGDKHDPVEVYTNDIYCHLRQNEAKFRPRVDYMEAVQTDVNHTMRSILIDWLVEVSEEYQLHAQTLHLAIAYIDRLLSMLPVNRTKLQLVGITSMLVASKYEEIFPPQIKDYVYISDGTYTKEEVLRMETVLLTSLKFCLTVPTASEFNKWYCRCAGMDKRLEAFTDFLTELVLQEPMCIKYPPSLVSSSAVFLTLFNANQRPWTPALEQLTGYKVDDLRECVHEMHGAHVRLATEQSTLKAVRDKYSHDKHYRVSLLQPKQL